MVHYLKQHFGEEIYKSFFHVATFQNFAKLSEVWGFFSASRIQHWLAGRLTSWNEQDTQTFSKPNQTALVDCSAFEGLIFCAVYWTMEKLQSLWFKKNFFLVQYLGEGIIWFWWVIGDDHRTQLRLTGQVWWSNHVFKSKFRTLLTKAQN